MLLLSRRFMFPYNGPSCNVRSATTYHVLYYTVNILMILSGPYALPKNNEPDIENFRLKNRVTGVCNIQL